MTTKEYNQLLRELGVKGTDHASALAAAHITGMGWRMSLRYAKGESEVPEPVARLLRALVALHALGYELDILPTDS